MLPRQRSQLRLVLAGAVLILSCLSAAAEEKPLATDGKPAGPPAATPVPVKCPVRADVSLAVQARQSAERAIPYIEKEGTAWIKDRKCLTCHYVAFMVW